MFICQAFMYAFAYYFGGFDMTIGERVLFLLSECGFSQVELAEAIGTTRATVNGWRKSNRNPSSDLIVPIAQFLHVPIYYLLTGEDEPEVAISKEDLDWLDIIHRIPEERQDMCKDFLCTHMVIPEKHQDKITG